MATAVVVEGLSKKYRIGRMKHETMFGDAFRRLLGRGGQSAPVDDADMDHWALRDVNFEVNAGEVIGIIGRNGAGKSTLLKVISRITHPTAGTIRVSGRVASLLEVGTGFHHELSGRDNVYMNGSILGMTKLEVDAQMGRIVEFAGFPKFMDTPIKRYSSGMKLRLGFAVAAHLDPDVLIVDEVLAVGDIAFQKKCLGAMSKLQSGGRTVLFVSHNMQAIERLCDRTIWIDGGEVRRDGPTAEVIHEYMSSFARGQSDVLDLAEIEDREGNGDIQFTGIEFLTHEDEPKTLTCSGDALKVRLHYEAKKNIYEPHFGFKLSTELGTLVTDLSTWATGMDIPELTPGKGTIDFEIDFLNLMPGDYYVSLWLRSMGPVHYDVLENFMEFRVLASDYYKSGRGIMSRFGLVFFPCRWRFPEP